MFLENSKLTSYCEIREICFSKAIYFKVCKINTYPELITKNRYINVRYSFYELAEYKFYSLFFFKVRFSIMFHDDELTPQTPCQCMYDINHNCLSA